MSIVTPRAIVSRWKNFSDSSGLNPAHLMCVTSTIVDFGGVATTSVFGDLGAAPSAATHVEGISMPFDALVVAASCKYVHDAAACDAAAGSTLSIDIMASPADNRPDGYAPLVSVCYWPHHPGECWYDDRTSLPRWGRCD